MVLKIGHRGIPVLEPENTLISFKKAIELGADAVECDVHLSKDGEIVVIHDGTVNRTTNGKGKVSKLMYTKIESLDAGKGEKIPLLKELLDLVRDKCKLNIEIKDIHATEKVLDLIENEDWSKIILSSSKLKVLFDIRKRNKIITTSLIFWSTRIPFKVKRLFDRALRTEVNAISLSKELATKSLISKLHQKNLKVYVWTVNKKKVIRKLVERGADGIFTNDIRLFKE